MKEKEATELLEDLGYKVKVREKTSPESQGQVLEQDPAPGEKAQNGTTITITVSDGDRDRKSVV